MRRGAGLFFSSLFLTTAFVVACSSASSSNNGSGGGGSGNGGSGGINVGGSGAINVDGGGGSGAFVGCDTQLYDGDLVPVDLFLMLDKSGSMSSSQNNTWGPVTSAISQFVDLPGLTKLGMGLGLFPTKPSTPAASGACSTNADCGFYECMPAIPILNPTPSCSGKMMPNDSCVATDYQTPVVPIGDLPGVGAAIKTAMASASPDGDSTTMTPALEGAIDYATIWGQQHPDRIAVVVLATDGEPNNCSNNDVNAVAAIADEGFKQTPSIRTFVIGMGSLPTLDTIAQKGGTKKAIQVSTGNAGQDFLKALNDIRGAVSCQFLVPQDGKSDPNKVNILFTPEGQTDGEVFPGVGTPDKCQGGKGWYYDVPPPGTPNQILLCPASCDLVSSVKGKVEVVFGCATKPPA